MVTWGRLTDLVNNAKGLTYESTLFFVFAKDDIQLFAIELNTGSPNINEFGQLFIHGVDSDGVKLSDIGGEYSEVTKDIKKFEGLPFDRVTLYNEGDFYRSWQFIQKEDSFVLRADTIKDGQDLQKRWGFELVGLTNESIQRLAKEVLPYIISHILRTLLS